MSKAFVKIHHHFQINTPNELSKEELPQLDKGHLQKAAVTRLNGTRTNPYLFFLSLYDAVWGVLTGKQGRKEQDSRRSAELRHLETGRNKKDGQGL